MIKPKALKNGDTIALIRPASLLERSAIDGAKKELQRLGFCVAQYSGRWRSDRFFSAPDEDRAAELDWAMREPGIRAVLVCRGGYGCQRTLARLSSQNWKRWLPKLIVGYSDLTYLHQWIQNQLGWVSIHGPLVGAMKPVGIARLMNELQALESKPKVQLWPEIHNRGSKRSARGLLVGGNLSLLQVAGPAALPKKPMILAIEEVAENYYRIDRMLRVLIDAGYRVYVKGILLGTFTKCGEKDSKTFGLDRIYESLRDLTDGPIWTNARFGHGLLKSTQGQRILPLGCQVSLSGKRFHIREAVVR